MVQAILGRQRKVHVVEQIESLHTELNGSMFGEPRILDERRVRGEGTRSPQYVFPRVAECSRCIYCERRGIEIFLDHRTSGPSRTEHYRTSHVIGLVLVVSAKRVIHTAINREWEPALPGHRAAQVPPVDKFACQPL